MHRKVSLALTWALIFIGLAPLLTAHSTVWAAAPERADTVFIGLKGSSCDFSFLVRQGQWVPDDVTGSTGLIRKSRPANLPIYLNGTRFWKPAAEGQWDTVVSRRCKVEDRGSFTTYLKAPVHVFLASECAVSGRGWYPDRAPKYFLFGQLPAGAGKDREADFIWISSDDKAAILALEDEFRQTLRWHDARPPQCSAR
jgi:hypothetical protein